MTNDLLISRLIRHFSYRPQNEVLSVSQLKRSVRRALQSMHPSFHDREVIEAMGCLVAMGIAQRADSRCPAWIVK